MKEGHVVLTTFFFFFYIFRKMNTFAGFLNMDRLKMIRLTPLTLPVDDVDSLVFYIFKFSPSLKPNANDQSSIVQNFNAVIALYQKRGKN